MRAWLLRSAVLLVSLSAACGDPAGEHPFMEVGSGAGGGAGNSGGAGTSGGGGGGNSGSPGVGGGSPGVGGAMAGTGSAPATGGTAGSGGGVAGSGGGVAGSGGGVSGSGGSGSGGSSGGGPTGFCNPPLNDPSVAQSYYTAWKGKYVTSGGSGVRVQRPENGNDTVSEGIAYGMLLAVYLDDRGTFDGLWSYAKSKMTNGLMNWRIDAGGQVIGQNAASDADEDMAWALYMAARKWGGSYKGEADTLTNNIYSQEVSGGQLKPGNMGLDGNRNPSYLAPAYYRLFAQETGQSGWMAVVDWSYSYLNQTANSSTGLVPDWTGSPMTGSNYGYDACRTPWRIAQDYCFNGEMRAKDYATKVTTFFANTIGIANVVDGYTLSGSPTGSAQNSMSYLGPIGVAAMAAGRAAVADDVLGRMTTLLSNTSDPAYSYFNSSWGMLSMLMLTNTFRPL